MKTWEKESERNGEGGFCGDHACVLRENEGENGVMAGFL